MKTFPLEEKTKQIENKKSKGKSLNEWVTRSPIEQSLTAKNIAKQCATCNRAWNAPSAPSPVLPTVFNQIRIIFSKNLITIFLSILLPIMSIEWVSSWKHSDKAVAWFKPKDWIDIISCYFALSAQSWCRSSHLILPIRSKILISRAYRHILEKTMVA